MSLKIDIFVQSFSLKLWPFVSTSSIPFTWKILCVKAAIDLTHSNSQDFFCQNCIYLQTQKRKLSYRLLMSRDDCCWLQSNEESERKAVTKILSRMFSDPGSKLAEENRPLWNCFLGRWATVCNKTNHLYIVWVDT